MPPSNNWTLVVSGGGSGGHLFPALAVIEELMTRERPPSRILFLTADRSIEQTVLNAGGSRYGIEHITLPAAESSDFRRRPLRAAWNMFRSIQAAAKVIGNLPSPIVLATGGYGSLPGGLAARWRRVPLILLEQNCVPGRAVSVLARFASHICTSFPGVELEELWPQKTTCTGNPIRHDIAQLATHRTEGSRRTILVMGGSQGAKRINQAMMTFCRQHTEQLAGWKIVHHTGKSDCPVVQAVYQELGLNAEVSGFFDNVKELYQQTGLVISRAGGTSLAEFACAGIPAILVPYPNSIRDHQEKNAQYFENAGAATLCRQTDPGFEDHLTTELLRMLGDETLRNRLAGRMQGLAQPNAAKQVVDVINTLRGE